MRYKSEESLKIIQKHITLSLKKMPQGAMPLVQLASGEEFMGHFNFLYSLSSLQLTLIFVTNQKEGAFQKRV